MFGHFIGIHYVENLKDHNCLVLGEKREIDDRHLVSLRRSPAEVRSRSNCAFVHGTQNRQLRNDPTWCRWRWGRSSVYLNKPSKNAWESNRFGFGVLLLLHRSQTAGAAGAQRIWARQFEKETGCFLSANSKQVSFAVTRRTVKFYLLLYHRFTAGLSNPVLVAQLT